MADEAGQVWRLGEILVQKGWLTWEKLEEALAIQKATGEVLGKILVEKGFMSSKDLYKGLAVQFKKAFVDFNKVEIPHEVIQLIPKRLAYEHRVIPLVSQGNTLLVAISNPMNVWPESELPSLVKARDIRTALASPEDIEAALVRYYGPE